MKNFLLILALCTSFAFSDEAQNLIFQNSYLSFQHPHSFQVSSETDSEGYKEIFIDGPNRTSVFITITPQLFESDLREYSDMTHEMMIKEAGMKGRFNRSVSQASLIIDGNKAPSITSIYSSRNILDRKKFLTTVYLIQGPRNTYIVMEERRGKYIEKHESIVKKIISSISIKK